MLARGFGEPEKRVVKERVFKRVNVLQRGRVHAFGAQRVVASLSDVVEKVVLERTIQIISMAE